MSLVPKRHLSVRLHSPCHSVFAVEALRYVAVEGPCALEETGEGDSLALGDRHILEEDIQEEDIEPAQSPRMCTPRTPSAKGSSMEPISFRRPLAFLLALDSNLFTQRVHLSLC